MKDQLLHTELFAQIAEGDEEAFKRLFEFYTPRLASFLTRVTRNQAETDELVQEVYIKIWMSRHLLTAVEHPPSWINGIAAHVAYAWLKTKIKHRTLITGIESNIPLQPDEPALHVNDLRNLISTAVSRLSPQRKKVYTLSREKGMTIPQIAVLLDLSPNTVKNTLVAALSELREELRAGGYDLPLLMFSWFACENIF